MPFDLVLVFIQTSKRASNSPARKIQQIRVKISRPNNSNAAIKMRRKSDLIVALKWLLPIFICLTLSIQAYRCDQTGKQSSNLRDPLVWNPNSLYDSNLDASNGLEKSLISSRRFKRSVSSSQSQPISFVDACQSRVEVITPFHATNSKGKLRTVVNSELMQQAIQIETCLR